MNDQMIEREVKGFSYRTLTCPFCFRLPEVQLDEPTNWDGTVWAWLRCGCRMKLHAGEHRSMRYEDWSNWERKLVDFRTKQQAQKEALEAVCKTWNTREAW